MKTGSISNFYIPGSTWVKQGILNCIPNISVSSKNDFKTVGKIAQKIVSPENNRLVLGATAILLQPLIDANNKKVDEQTRKFSVIRTIAKIIAGTTVGYCVRYGCVKAIETFTKLPTEITPGMKLSKWRSALLPENLNLIKNMNTYKKSLGTVLGLIVMLFTNFLLDAPLTKFLTNKFMSKGDNNKTKNANIKEVKHE